MIYYSDVVYEGYSCLQISNPQLSIWISRDFGPRVIGLALRGGENLMVVLPDARIPVEGREDYTLRGGHRLWYAPERPETTYLPDDKPVEIERIPGGVSVQQAPDQPTGIQKSLRIVLDQDAPRLEIEHRLANTSSQSFFLAPWAVTMLKPGGIGAIPLRQDPSDPHGLWPNRQVAFWPYTDLGSPSLRLDNQALFVRADLKGGAIKVGAPNPTGWISYALYGTLFIKRADYDPEKTYLDRGASSQIYTNPAVIELETLGPAVELAPGETTLHSESWQVFGKGEWPGEIQDLYQSGGFA